MVSGSDGRTEQYGFFVPVFPASGPLNIWMTLQWTPFLWQAGGTEFDSTRNRALFNSEAGVQALTLWKMIYDQEDFSKVGIGHDMGFVSGKLAMIMDGPWDLPRFRQAKEIDWAVAPLPAGPGGRATYLAGEQLTIFRQSSHPAAAWTFVKWMLRPDVQARFSETSGYLPLGGVIAAQPEDGDNPGRIRRDERRAVDGPGAVRRGFCWRWIEQREQPVTVQGIQLDRLRRTAAGIALPRAGVQRSRPDHVRAGTA